MKVQLDNIRDFPIKGAAFNKGETELALSFFDGSFAVLNIDTALNDSRIAVHWRGTKPAEYLVEAGAFTQQELDDYHKQIKQTRDDREEQRDQALLARLKAKYE